MTIGLVACVTKTGLGYQGLTLAKMLQPSKVLVPDISAYNGYSQHPEWYDNFDTTFVKGFPTSQDIQSFVDGLDIIIVTEASYNDYLYTYARSRGVKTVNIQNYEFFGWAREGWPYPDSFVSPTTWHYDSVQKFCDQHNLLHTYLHHPVERNQFPFHEIRKASRFVHSAGRSAAHDRAGTYTIIDATKYIQSDIRVTIHFQGNQGLRHQLTSTTNDYIEYARKKGNQDKLEIIIDDFDHPTDIYRLGDVYVQPRRYGGNNVVMGEALSCGLPTIMTDISPNNQFLPKHWLVPATKIGEFTPRTTISIYEADAKALAAKIDWFATLDEETMLAENAIANNLAESISVEKLQPKYMAFIESIMKVR